MEVPRILVVDDEEIVLRLLHRTLTGQGYIVETAKDGDAAFEKAKRNFFNLLIIDLRMPVLSGMEVLKKIKRLNPYIEVIVITGFPTIDSAVETIKIGAYDFICKPFDIHQVHETVKRCLEKQKHTLRFIELRELVALFEMTKTISVVDQLDKLLMRILDSAMDMLRVKQGMLLLFDNKSRKFEVKASRGIDEQALSKERPELNYGVIAEVVNTKEPVMVIDIHKDERFKPEDGHPFTTDSLLSVPLISSSLPGKGNVVGVISIADKFSNESFTKREQILLSVLAGEGTVAIENARLYIQLKNKIDALKLTVKKLNEARNQLIQSEKMAAVGQLAFGIAHEIRNPLGIILGGVEYLEYSVVDKKNKVAQESLTKVKNSITRANDIIIELLKFSRASQLNSKLVNVCAIIEEALALVEHQAYLKNIKIKKSYRSKQSYVKADPTMLRQVFFNLNINAIDAMPKGGTLSVNIKQEIKKQKATNYLIVEIEDTGKGIPKEKLSKVFEPFFTTKEPGQGTGLGLSIAHLILERHKADIKVESTTGKGTKFIIKLPLEKKLKRGTNVKKKRSNN